MCCVAPKARRRLVHVWSARGARVGALSAWESDRAELVGLTSGRAASPAGARIREDGEVAYLSVKRPMRLFPRPSDRRRDLPRKITAQGWRLRHRVSDAEGALDCDLCSATGWLARGGRPPALGGPGHRRRGVSTAARRVRGRPGLAAAATEGCHPQEAASRPTARRKPHASCTPCGSALHPPALAVASRLAPKRVAGRSAWRAEGVPLNP